MKVSLKNLGTVNKNSVELGDFLKIYFSYETPIAYHLTGYPSRVCQNDWSQTTGKFINELEPDKKRRIPVAQFERELGAILDAIKVGNVDKAKADAEKAEQAVHND